MVTYGDDWGPILRTPKYPSALEVEVEHAAEADLLTCAASLFERQLNRIWKVPVAISVYPSVPKLAPALISSKITVVFLCLRQHNSIYKALSRAKKWEKIAINIHKCHNPTSPTTEHHQSKSRSFPPPAQRSPHDETMKRLWLQRCIMAKHSNQISGGAQSVLPRYPAPQDPNPCRSQNLMLIIILRSPVTVDPQSEM